MGADALPAVERLYDVAPCGLLVLAVDGRLLDVNATFCRWLSYGRPELLAGQRLQDLLTTGSRIFLHTHLQPLLRMQGSVAEVKLEVRRKDRGTIPMIFNITEQAWEGTRLWQAAAFIAEDRHLYERELLAQRRRAEELAQQHVRDQEELKAARSQAEDRAIFSEQLVGVVSHDLRNSLSVIQMSAVLLERGLVPDQQATVVGRIARAVDRLQRLVADLLDFTQARLGGGLPVQPIACDLHRAVGEAVAELALAFEARSLRHVAQGPQQWQADPARIAQAVGNLVANAVHHGDPLRPVTITTQGEQDAFRISVHNHGAPIPPDTLPRLFEPMVRGSGASSKGVGLGLYIVQAIARGHGGHVEVRSEAQAGTTFTMVLPPPGR